MQLRSLSMRILVYLASLFRPSSLPRILLMSNVAVLPDDEIIARDCLLRLSLRFGL